MVNGLFVGQPMRLQAITDDCRSEVAVIAGVNQSWHTSDTQWVAICVKETPAEHENRN
jgi:hypothetical protein